MQPGDTQLPAPVPLAAWNSLEEQFEACDDGAQANVGHYGDRTGCTPGCALPSYCGDGIVNCAHGEECDEGGATPTCDAQCRIPRP